MSVLQRSVEGGRRRGKKKSRWFTWRSGLNVSVYRPHFGLAACHRVSFTTVISGWEDTSVIKSFKIRVVITVSIQNTPTHDVWERNFQCYLGIVEPVALNSHLTLRVIQEKKPHKMKKSRRCKNDNDDPSDDPDHCRDLCQVVLSLQWCRSFWCSKPLCLVLGFFYPSLVPTNYLKK